MNKILNVVAAMGFVAAVASTHAATFTVTNTNDSGTGSLRDAITQANLSAPPNTVNFDSAVTGAITLTTGQIRIAGPMSIVGPGANILTIDGNASSRIFSIFATDPACPALDGPDYLVSISGIRLANARRNVDASGGAIFTEHSLTLDSVTIENSMARVGGGISFQLQYPGQALTISNSQFSNNIAKLLVPTVAGTHNSGGAIWITEKCTGTQTTPAPVTITNSVFQGNRSQPTTLLGHGGAIGTNAYADITITDTKILDNHVDVPNPPVANARYNGGGIWASAKSLRIERSEIVGNSAETAGGLQFFNDASGRQSAGAAMTASIINSTVSGNVVSATGGAMLMFANVALELVNSTVSDNTAPSARTGGLVFTTGPTAPATASNATAPTLTLVSTILANNSSDGGDVATNLALIPTFTINATNSLIEKICPSPGCEISVAGSGNLLAVDPLLGPLALNGGSSRTHALLTGSPAINAGSNPSSLTTDQRGAGFVRVGNGAADMGAYETSSRLINLSTRGQVQTGDNVMIGGFIIDGSSPKKVLIRAVGPNLANYGVSGVLLDPTLQLYSGPSVIASNDNWGTASNAADITATGLAPVDDLESAILTTLSPGAYTAIVSGNGGGTGVGIVEVYELDHPEIPLINISTRGKVLTGDNVMIGGFIIQGTTSQTVLIRAVGPNLAAYGVTGVLTDPKLELYAGQSVIATNDDWGTAINATDITATGLAPVSAKESAILITLQPGAYTAIVSGADGGSGVGIVEVFAR